ncbi:hypothetical protein [Streptomyces sp. URMC 125]|uniref:hypothetical protein n=1 Tax=Streptomyces sp. URMC 125 TaxID=3423419 RepID=UPI003F1AE757
MRTLLRELVNGRNWQSYSTFRTKFRRAAQELAEREGDPRLATLTFSESTYERWLSGRVRPVPDARRVLVHMFGYDIETLLAPPQGGETALHSVSAAGAPTTLRTEPGADVREMGRQAAMAASRALRFAVTAESNTVGDETMDHLREEVTRIAAQYPRVPLHQILGDLVEVQDLVFRLLESGRGTPAQSRDLNLLASMASGMLAKAGHDLGDPKSAMAQARAAYVCADTAGHPQMRAWTRGLQSLVCYWAGRPAEAVTYAQRGRTEGQLQGTIAVWLHSLEARAHAVLNDRESTLRAIAQAVEADELAVEDELDRIGGILTFPRPRRMYYTAEAEVLLAEHLPQAEQHAQDAVTAYRNARPEEWAFGDEAGACTNLAIARLDREELEGAAEALRPVLDLEVGQRNAGIVLSARRVADALGRGPLAEAHAARDLRSEIEVFTASPTPALPR